MPTFDNYPAPVLPMTGNEIFVASQKQGTAQEPVSPTLFDMVAKYAVSALPTVGVTQGAMAYALDGRNTGEGSGAGTGCLCTYNLNGVWAAVWSGVQVEA